MISSTHLSHCSLQKGVQLFPVPIEASADRFVLIMDVTSGADQHHSFKKFKHARSPTPENWDRYNGLNCGRCPLTANPHQTQLHYNPPV